MVVGGDSGRGSKRGEELPLHSQLRFNWTKNTIYIYIYIYISSYHLFLFPLTSTSSFFLSPCLIALAKVHVTQYKMIKLSFVSQFSFLSDDCAFRIIKYLSIIVFSFKSCWLFWLFITPGQFSRRYHCVHSKPMYMNLCWLVSTGVPMCRSPLENVPCGFVLTSLAVPSMSCSSY